MPTSDFTFFYAFPEELAEEVHDLENDTLKVALVAEANTPPLTGLEVSNLTAVSLANLADDTLTVSSSAQVSGAYSCVISDKTLTASGGSVGPFRYIVFYNDTSTNDRLIGYYDYGSDVTLPDGSSLSMDLNSSGTILIS